MNARHFDVRRILAALAGLLLLGALAGCPSDKPAEDGGDKPAATDEAGGDFNESAFKKEAEAEAEKEITPDNAEDKAAELEKEIEADMK